jgi:hypothetical protein
MNDAKWKPGQSGNPSGKPRGARNRATVAALAIMESGAREIVQRVVTAAKDGDLAAARIVLDKLMPPARERPLAISLPPIDTVQGVAAAQGAILEACAAGDLLPGEATALSGIVEARRRSLETEELEARVRALEERDGTA